MISMKAIVSPSFRLFLATLFKPDIFREIVAAEAKEIDKLYAKTYSTWNDKPTFNTKIAAGRRKAEATVWTEHEHYWFAHEGVSVLRAVFSNDWVAKTQPRVLASGPGKGQKLYASKKISKPSYKPREFTQEIVTQRQDKFVKAAQGRLDRFAAGVRRAP